MLQPTFEILNQTPVLIPPTIKFVISEGSSIILFSLQQFNNMLFPAYINHQVTCKNYITRLVLHSTSYDVQTEEQRRLHCESIQKKLLIYPILLCSDSSTISNGVVPKNGELSVIAEVDSYHRQCPYEITRIKVTRTTSIIM